MNELAGSRVLVIGGAGFVGSHIVDQLLAEPVARDRRARQLRARQPRQPRRAAAGRARDARRGHDRGPSKLLATLMAGTDYVFHLAALWLYECVHEPRRAIEVNVVGTFNVIEAAHGARASRRSSTRRRRPSTATRSYTPMTEDHPFNNRTMYGATKIAGEQFFRAFHEQHGLDYVGLRYMNVYGPRMDYKGTYVSVIMKVLDRIDAGEPPRDLRRRLAGLRLRPRRGRRPGEHPRAEERRDRRVLQRRHRRQDDDQGARRRAARGDRQRASSPSTGRRSRCSSPTASAAPRWPRSCSASAPRSIWTTGLRSTIDWRDHERSSVATERA